MPKYLIRGNYVGDGVKGLLQEGGTKRHDAAKAAVESIGGSVDCMYYAFGDTDVFAICDFPDDATAAAASLTISSSGVVKSTITPLMAPADLDAASGKSASYRPPGG
jgi:uncharacterized protein with GYD domain